MTQCHIGHGVMGRTTQVVGRAWDVNARPVMLVRVVLRRGLMGGLIRYATQRQVSTCYRSLYVNKIIVSFELQIYNIVCF